MTRHVHPRSAVVIALSFLAGALAYPRLVDPFPDGQPSFRLLIAFALPTATLVIDTLFRSLWRHDRVRSGNGALEATYQAIVLRALLFVFALHVVIMVLLTDLMDGFGVRTWGARSVMVMLGLTIAAIGNLLPRTRPNVVLGLRTARTLSSTHLWQQVHRLAGNLTVGLGVITAATGVLLKPIVGVSASFLAAALATAILFVSYRKSVRV